MAGLLDWGFMSPSARQALLRTEEEQRQRRGQQVAGNDTLRAYQGILSNPDLGPGGAGNIAGLLGSADPEVRAQGQNLIAQYLGQRSPQGQANLQATRTGIQSQQQDIAQQGIMGPLQQQLARQQIAANNAQLKAAANPPPLAPGERLAQEFMQQNGSAIPNGMRPVRRMGMDPQGQPFSFVDIQPIESSPEYKKDEEALRSLEESIRQVDDFMDLLAETGTEKGGEKARQLRQKRDRVIGAYAKWQGLGVLQPGEVERLDSILPNPTDFAEQWNPMAGEAIYNTYEGLRQQAIRQLQEARQRYWYIQPGKVLPQDYEQQGASGGW